jgi:hypothetical protein
LKPVKTGLGVLQMAVIYTENKKHKRKQKSEHLFLKISLFYFQSKFNYF